LEVFNLKCKKWAHKY